MTGSGDRVNDTPQLQDQKPSERQVKIDRIRLLGISQDGLERVLSTAKARNKARERERTGAIFKAVASNIQLKVDSNE